MLRYRVRCRRVRAHSGRQVHTQTRDSSLARTNEHQGSCRRRASADRRGGGRVLREGGNAVDAAVAAVLTSFVTESPLTGFGAGGFMLVHDAARRTCCWTSSSRSRAAAPASAAPSSFRSRSTSAPSRRRCSTSARRRAACPGRPRASPRRSSATARFRSPSSPASPPGSPARGCEVNAEQAFIFRDPGADPHPRAGVPRRSTRPTGRMLAEGDMFRFAELGDALERYGAEGPEPVLRAARSPQRVSEMGARAGRHPGPG